MSGSLDVPFGVFGKVPWRPEYLRIRSEGEPFASFDAFLTQNVEWSAVHAGHAFAEAARHAGTHAFMFRPRVGSTVLVGALQASADSAGRTYPLVVAAPLAGTPAELASAPEFLPLVLEDLWQHASEAAIAIRGAGTVERATNIAANDTVWSSTPAHARESFDAWAASLPLFDLWSLVYGEQGHQVAEQVVRFLREAIRPHRGTEFPRTPMSFRLPLGAAGGAAVCFWIAVVRRSAHWRATIPSLFWSHDGESGDILIFLGDPGRSTLADLWMPREAKGDLCDLTRWLPPAQLASIPELPSSLAPFFRAAGPSVSEFIAALGAS